ncbi:AraC family transcriptional regulator [Psychromonas sp. Urea-02u-13]|uniref:AraC family transcriptional regulator n=1 Tax=Psychromonas sp. Urea-02u-13 TaxID=2058326 RepID=UPI000C325ACE|nr:AraC family transcriptional regulator [Psychromonas sp. Urea-02u-13]PKG38434.1 hypothetical protein CXF74_13100 [Psychromonas sp. Urea-02u-13]
MQEWPELCDVSSLCKQQMFNKADQSTLSTLGYIQAGYCDAAEKFSMYRQDPDFHMMLFTTHGEGILHTPNESFQLEAGSLIIVPAGQMNGFDLNGDHWSIAWVMLDAKLKWPSLKESGVYLQTTNYAGVLRHTIESLLLNMQYSQFDDQALEKMLVDQLQHIVEQSLHRKTQVSAVQMRLQHFTYLLSQQLHKNWNVEQMAALIFCSPAHLYRLTNQWLGKSPMQHLQTLRIERAKQTLESQNWSINDVALQVGFKDLANFSRRFKTLVGQSPSAYRASKRS